MFSSLPKMNIADMLKGPIDLSEVQDFSMPKKQNLNTSPSVAAAFGGKGKLDDMLSKLMKKNNCVSIQKKFYICGRSITNIT